MRGPRRKGVRYFGPYAHAWAIRETLDLLLRVFPARTCSDGRLQAGRPARPAVPARLHRQVLGALRRPGQRRGAPRDRRRLLRLHGRPDRRRSSAGSRRRCTRPQAISDYERAARLRDDIGALERAMEKQAVVLGDGADADVIAFAEDELEAAVQVFYVRGGRVRGQRGWVVDQVEDSDEPLATWSSSSCCRSTRDDGDRQRRCRARSWSRRCRRTPRRAPSCCASCAAPGSSCGCRSAATSGAARDRRAQRPAGLRAAQAQAGERPDRADRVRCRRSRTRSGSPRRRCASSASTSPTCRAPRSSRQHGRLRGRPGPQERVPPVRHARARRPGRRRLDAPGDPPPVQPLPRGAREDRRARRRTRGRRRPGAGEQRTGIDPTPAGHEVRLPAQPRRRRRRPAAGRRGRGRAWPSSASTTSRCAAWPSGWRRSGCRTTPTR